MRAVSRLCEFYPGICLTTEEKARKNLSQGKKNRSQVKKNLSQSTVYILPKHPHIIKPPQTHMMMMMMMMMIIIIIIIIIMQIKIWRLRSAECGK